MMPNASADDITAEEAEFLDDDYSEYSALSMNGFQPLRIVENETSSAESVAESTLADQQVDDLQDSTTTEDLGYVPVVGDSLMDVDECSLSEKVSNVINAMESAHQALQRQRDERRVSGGKREKRKLDVKRINGRFQKAHEQNMRFRKHLKTIRRHNLQKRLDRVLARDMLLTQKYNDLREQNRILQQRIVELERQNANARQRDYAAKLRMAALSNGCVPNHNPQFDVVPRKQERDDDDSGFFEPMEIRTLDIDLVNRNWARVDVVNDRVEYMSLVIHKRSNIVLQSAVNGVLDARMEMTDFGQLSDHLARYPGDILSLQFTQVTVGKSLMDFFEPILTSRVAGRSLDNNDWEDFHGAQHSIRATDFRYRAILQMVNFTESSVFFSRLHTAIFVNLHELRLLNVRRVKETEAVRLLLRWEESEIDTLELFNFTNEAGRNIRYDLYDILVFLHHYRPHRRRTLKMFIDNTTYRSDHNSRFKGDVFEGVVNGCVRAFTHYEEKTPCAYRLILMVGVEQPIRVDKDERYCFDRYRRSVQYKRMLRNAATQEKLKILSTAGGPANNWKQRLIIERG